MDGWPQILDDVLARGGDLLVRTGTAVVVSLVIIGAGMLFRPLLRRRLDRQGRPSRTNVFTALYGMLVVLAGVLLAITLAFPSVKVADVLASLGVLSVAVGFAFKDVLENLLAGVLLLLRDPFKTGDEIKVAGYEGVVEGVTVRETLLRTYDGERVLIPNAKVYTGSLEVRTHYPTALVSFRLLLDPESDPGRVRSTVSEALLPLATDSTPAPQVVVTGASTGALEIEVRMWSRSERAERSELLDRAVPAAVKALRAAGIVLNQPRTVLLQDGGDE